MPLWAAIAVIGFVWLMIGLVVGIATGKILKNDRKFLEDDAITRVSKAITEFLNQKQDNDVVMYRDTESGKVKSEEALDGSRPCVVCVEYDCADDEDMRPLLILVRDRYIPLCTSHKEFVSQCLKDGISLDNGPTPL